MAHAQIDDGKVIAVFGGPQDVAGYQKIADDDPRLLAFYAPPVPRKVTMRQARLALLGAGLLDAVDAAVAKADRATQIDWEFAATVERGSPTVNALAAALKLSSKAQDSLFSEASKL